MVSSIDDSSLEENDSSMKFRLSINYVEDEEDESLILLYLWHKYPNVSEIHILMQQIKRAPYLKVKY